MKTKRGLYLQRNKGFSIIELVVVIAVMVILTGTVSMGYAALTGKRAKQARADLESAIDTIRTNTMGKKNVTGWLYKDGDHYIMEITSSIDDSGTSTTREIELGNKNVTISYDSGSGNTPSGTAQEVDNIGIDIAFDRASGALRVFGQHGAAAPATLADEYYFTATERNKEFGIRIYSLTGKIERIK